MKKTLISLCLFLVMIISGCQCDLSHKHYYNEYGVCICGSDIAQKLSYSNSEYTSTTYNIKQGEIYYYKFTSHGENGVDFHLESDNVMFDRIEIRADGMLQTIATRKEYDDKLYTYDKSLTNDRVYYLKITYKGDGSIKLILKDAI